MNQARRSDPSQSVTSSELDDIQISKRSSLGSINVYTSINRDRMNFDRGKMRESLSMARKVVSYRRNEISLINNKNYGLSVTDSRVSHDQSLDVAFSAIFSRRIGISSRFPFSACFPPRYIVISGSNAICQVAVF